MQPLLHLDRRFDEKLEGVMRVSVVATGIDALTQSAPLPFVNTDTASSGGADDMPMHMAKMKQVINFGNLTPTSFASSTGEQSIAEKATDSHVVTELQSATTASLSEQIKPEQPVKDVNSAETEQADETVLSNPTQLDLETAARQAEPQGAGQEEEPADNVSSDNNTAEQSAGHQAETHEQATIIRRPDYIPAASKDVGTDDEVLSAAAELPALSLLNRFSGIWSSKPADKLIAAHASVKQGQDKPAEKTEPVLKEQMLPYQKSKNP